MITKPRVKSSTLSNILKKRSIAEVYTLAKDTLVSCFQRKTYKKFRITKGGARKTYKNAS